MFNDVDSVLQSTCTHHNHHESSHIGQASMQSPSIRSKVIIDTVSQFLHDLEDLRVE